jgi:hypothetical protein
VSWRVGEEFLDFCKKGDMLVDFSGFFPESGKMGRIFRISATGKAGAVESN